MPTQDNNQSHENSASIENGKPCVSWYKRCGRWALHEVHGKPWEIILTIATVALAWFTLGLWNDTHELLIDAQKTSTQRAGEVAQSLALTQSSVAATNKLADAAKTANEIAMLINRPYLAVDRI
jgi:hypothetical protein